MQIIGIEPALTRPEREDIKPEMKFGVTLQAYIGKKELDQLLKKADLWGVDLEYPQHKK
jgi:hypothetical protein